jgi:hypothetical protein
VTHCDGKEEKRNYKLQNIIYYCYYKGTMLMQCQYIAHHFNELSVNNIALDNGHYNVLGLEF